MTESTALVKRLVDPSLPEMWTEERIALVARTVAKGATIDELALFLSHCQRLDLNPFLREAYFLKDRSGNVSIVTGIDGYRKLAIRTGEFEGEIGPQFKAGSGSDWQDFPPEEGAPYACRVGVWRRHFREPVWGIVTYASFFRDTPTWKKMPARMMEVRAEAQALRKAFPAELAGVSVNVSSDGVTSSVVVVDADAKATNAQIAKLHMQSKELGLSDDERHEMAGVDSFADLTKGQAHDLIEVFQSMLDESSGGEILGPEKGASSPPVTPAAETPVKPQSPPEHAPRVPPGKVPIDEESGLPNPVVFPAGPLKGSTLRDLGEHHWSELVALSQRTDAPKLRAAAAAWMEWFEARRTATGDAPGNLGNLGSEAEEPLDGELEEEIADPEPHEFDAAGGSWCAICTYPKDHPLHSGQMFPTEEANGRR